MPRRRSTTEPFSRVSEADPWFVALGLALVAQRLTPPGAAAFSGDDEAHDDAPDDGVSVAAVTAWLADQGWTPERVQQHREQCRADGVPWPHPVPPQELGPGTAARFLALLAQVRAALGVTGLVATQRPEHRVIGPAERRLLADVPPHHGSV